MIKNFIFDMGGIWVSCERGLIKPDRRAFEDMFHMFGLTPEECFFIDDSISNIDAGRLCGMDGLVYICPESFQTIGCRYPAGFHGGSLGGLHGGNAGIYV